MEKLTIRDKRKISRYILENFAEEKIELSNYLDSNKDELVRELELEIDSEDLIYTIADVNSSEFEHFAEIIKEEIKHASGRSKVKLTSEFGIISIERSAYGLSINNGFEQRLKKTLANLKYVEKGFIIFENFCVKFLKDFNFINVKATKTSNDLGIDIIGAYKIEDKKRNMLLNILRPQSISLLAQAKFYDSPVDTSYIRKLIGDSLFIRFDKANYPTIRHNPVYLIFFSYSGFTSNARNFAKENNVTLIDADFMIDLICSTDDCQSLASTKYLLN